MTRREFMEFFKDDEKLNTLSVEDRHEIFLSILPGSSDITKELLEELLSDYDVELSIVESSKLEELQKLKDFVVEEIKESEIETYTHHIYGLHSEYEKEILFMNRISDYVETKFPKNKSKLK